MEPVQAMWTHGSRPFSHLCFLIVACNSPPFLFSPLPFVCLALLLGIWPTIDKTQSLTMLGAWRGIGGDGGAHALWQVCVCWGFWEGDGIRLTLLFIYLSTSRWQPAERMCLLTPSAFLSSLDLSIPPSLPWLTRVWRLVFRSRTSGVR